MQFKIKKIIFSVILISLFFYFSAFTRAQAACPPQPCTGTICIPNPICAESFEELIENLIDFIFWAAVAIAPIMIIVAGAYLVFSGGDPEKVKRAKSIILWTIIGFVIVLLAKGLVSMVKQIIGG